MAGVPDIDRLVKLFNRFGDDNEGEAVSALRFFRKNLKDSGLRPIDLTLSLPDGDLIAIIRQQEREKLQVTLNSLYGQVAALDGTIATLTGRLRTAQAANQSLTREKADLAADVERLSKLLLRTAVVTPIPRGIPAKAAKAQPRPPSPPPAKGDGYQWGTIILPHGTELRLKYKAADYIAQVVDGTVVYKALVTTPWGFMKAVKRNHPVHPTIRTGNPFAEIWVKRPADADWTQANKLRAKK